MAEKFADLTLDQRIDVLGSDYYGMVFLGMANAAYTDAAATWTQAIADELETTITSTDYTPALPELGQEGAREPTAVVPGAWRLDWGPAFPSTTVAKRSNLIYIASYRDEAGAPYFFVVGIRGTDISAGGESVLEQVFQDFDAFRTVEWADLFKDERQTLAPSVATGPIPSGRVAQGSFDGARDLLKSIRVAPEGHTQPSETLREALIQLLAQPDVAAGTPIVVTGHSLGGCQTQTIASYVQWLCPQNVVIPHAFAPSTAGDVEFISNPVFERGAFWFNTLDLVPWGYVTVRTGTEDPYPDAIPDPKTIEKPQKTMPGGPELGAEWADHNLWASFDWPPNDDGLTTGPDLPARGIIKDLIAKWGETLMNNRYARPNPSQCPNVLKKMNGSIPTPAVIQAFYKSMHPTKNDVPEKTWSDGVVQLEWQHFPPNYQILLWENYKSSMVYFDYKNYPNSPSKSVM